MKNFLKQIFGLKSKSVALSEKKLVKKNAYKAEEDLKKDIEQLKINGFHLPKSIITRIKTDAWKEPLSSKRLQKLVLEKFPFEDENEIEALKEMINHFTLYSLGLMKNESECLYKWLHPKWDKERAMLLGKKDDNIFPGDIDIEKVILFADFGHGSDTPIGLDFRDNEKKPSVILLYWGEDCNKDNRWKKIANSFEEFEQIIWKEK